MRSRRRLPSIAQFQWWFFIFPIAFWLANTSSSGSDWPQYRGLQGDGSSPERILTVWPPNGPRQLWKKALPDGYGSFAVSGGKAFTAVKRRIDGVPTEVFIALNAETGEELWAQPVAPSARETVPGEGDGPRSTPTIEGDRVYLLTGFLVLSCLSASDGTVIWRHDLIQEYGGRGPDFEASASPLLEGDLVLVNGPIGGTGEKILAYHKEDGRLIWQGPLAKLTHSTPIALNFLGVRQVLFFTQGGMLSIIPQTGQVLWRYNFSVNIPTVISPVVGEDIVYHSAGYGVGARAVRVTKSGETFSASLLWRKSGQLMNFISTPIYFQGHLYGLFGDRKYGTGPLSCVELASGTEKWSQAGFGVGQLLLVDNHLLVQDDDGALVLVKPDPERYIQTARFPVFTTKAWNGPALSNGRIYARSVKEGACIDVALPPPPRVKLTPNYAFGTGFGLLLRHEDGSSLDEARAADLQLFFTSDLSLPLLDWNRWTGPALLTNGLLKIEDSESKELPHRFFQVRDPQ